MNEPEQELDTTGDVDPPTPAQSRRFRWALQLWVILLICIVISGLTNYIYGYFGKWLGSGP